MQSGLCNRGRIEAAFESKSGFFRCVIKSANDEVFAVMSLRTSRQFFVFRRKTFDNFKPGDVRPDFRTSEDAECRKPGDQMPKSDSIGPPIKISMGSRFHSYS